MSDPHTFFRELYEDSPLETAQIERVNKTPVSIPSTTGDGETQIQIPHYSCRVVTERGRRFDNVPWQSPYVNPATGAGLYIIPKQGTSVLLGYSKKGQPYIVGFLTPISLDGRFTGNREVLPDGSICMRGDTGNKICVVDGGVITIQSTPVCKRTYSPSLDQIRDFCRNYFLTTAGGFLAWTESTDGRRLTTLRYKAFEKAGGEKDGGKSVEVRYGTHSEDEPHSGKLFSFVVKEGTVVTIGPDGTISVDNTQGADSNIDVKNGKDITIDNQGKFTLNNVQDVKIESSTGAIDIETGAGASISMDPSGNITVESPFFVTIKAPQVNIEAAATVNIQSPVTTTTGKTNLGGGGLPVARLFDQVLVQTSDGPAIGPIIQGSALTGSA